MADQTTNFSKLCHYFPKKSPEYLLEMLTKYNGNYERTVDAIQKDGNFCIKFFRNLVGRCRKFINNAKSNPSQNDEQNEVFEVNIGQDLAKTLREKFENSTSLRVPEGFDPVISMPASMGKKLYLLYAESVFHQEETQKLEVEVRLAREDEEFARRIQEAEEFESEEIKKKNAILMSQSRRPKQGEVRIWDTTFACRDTKPVIESSSLFDDVPKRSALTPKSTSEARDDLGLLDIWKNRPFTNTNSEMKTLAVESIDSYNEQARSILSKSKLPCEEMKRKLKSQQALFVPGSPLSTVKPKLKLSTERYDESLKQHTWQVEDISNTFEVYPSNSQQNLFSQNSLDLPSYSFSGIQNQSGPSGTKIKSNLHQFVNPIIPFTLNEFESNKIIEKNSQEFQSASYYRDKAQTHLKNKQKYEEMAKSLLQDDIQLSRHYFQLSKEESRNWEECNHLAALFFLSENLENSSRSNIIDLHHLYVKEALQCLDIFLDKEICLLQIECKKSKKVSIITGRGKHSLHGIAKIKPEIARRLTERGLEFEEQNPGLLKATIRRGSCMTTDLTRSYT